MSMLQLGKSGPLVRRPGFGALPLQRLDMGEAVSLLRAAVDGGITFFDTARGYTDSEEKLGRAFSAIRGNLVIATKSMGGNRAEIEADFAASLKALRTDYLDLYQVHNAKTLPGPDSEIYRTFADLKRAGRIRAIGLTAHSLSVALEAARSGLYATVQYPFSLLASPAECELVSLCRERGVGFIAMKALAGGLVADIPAAHAFIRQQEGVLPIWGMQTREELESFLELERHPPAWDDAMRARVDSERASLAGRFCRGCGYCQPCPQGIAIQYVARMARLLRRSPWRQYAEKEWADRMAAAKTCVHCGECVTRCPYGLDTPALVAENLADYESFMKARGVQPW